MKPSRFLKITLLGAVTAALLSSPLHAQAKRSDAARSGEFRNKDKHTHHSVEKQRGLDKLVAVLTPTAGNQARGTVTFEAQANGKVKVTAQVEGLNRDSEHAIHVHEFGDIRADDGTSAGGHYNPEGHPHALPEEKKRHAGDFGNLEADSNGRATLSLTVDNLSLAGKKNPVIGRAVIVHAEPDDGGQPTGNAGARIAAGVIGVANPATAN